MIRTRCSHVVSGDASIACIRITNQSSLTLAAIVESLAQRWLIKTNKSSFGMIRNLDDPLKIYDHESHQDQYSKLADFVLNFVQQTMVQTYNL